MCLLLFWYVYLLSRSTDGRCHRSISHPSIIANMSSSSGAIVFKDVLGKLDLSGAFNLSRTAMITLVYIGSIARCIEICSRSHGPLLLHCRMVGAHVGRSRGLSCRSLKILGSP